MTKKVAVQKTSPRSVQAVEYRFIVKSAAEAVVAVREKLGPNAQVISVRQVKGGGLQRFLASPRLEILARAPEAVPEEPVPPPVVSAAAVPPEPILEPEKVAAAVPASEAAVAPQRPQADVAESMASAPPSAISRVRQTTAMETLSCGKFLNRAGFPDVLIARFSSDAQWREICQLPLSEGLTQAIRWLRTYREQTHYRSLTNRVAFLGGPGSGKTTALCKVLARDVFIRGLCPQVLRLEVDKPHLDDGLLLYCEVLGVPCFRSEAEVDFSEDRLIYVDLPGYSLSEQAEQDRIAKVLEQLNIDSRVLVMNAAYESGVLHRFAESGERLGARFQILTHLDELDRIGKLWAYLLDTQRQLLLFSNGQNIAGDRIDDAFGFLIERTFPR